MVNGRNAAKGGPEATQRARAQAHLYALNRERMQPIA